MKTEKIMQNGWIVFGLTMVCCLLWGSAFPCVKIGYQLFGIGTTDTFSQITFGGIRFFLAGIFTLLLGSLMAGKWLVPTKKSIPMIGKLGLLQTTIQYVFFNIGLARTTGVKASIIEASNVFVAILIASLIFRQEKLTFRKLIGCVLGFAGVVIFNVTGSELDFSFNLLGEGFIFCSTVAYALSSALTKKYSKTENPVMLCAYQFLFGGAVMTIIGILGGGNVQIGSWKSVILLLYLAFLSAAAFSIWGVLLKYNPVSKVSIYGFMNPVFGVILSALLLTEQNEGLGIWRACTALFFVTVGIIIVNVPIKKQAN